jgi:VIT1/CCC1 family predicted Fe2+/Mn2+ transporter
VAVLGANDGTISVASLVVGIAASGAGRPTLLLSGLAATVAGALSMAAGEYVSVQSQADTEAADLAREKQELADDPSGVLAELAQIYVERGLSRDLARQVAEQLTLQDALGAHRRDELGLSDAWQARPIQAALASAASFLVGALLPILTLLVSPPSRIRDVTTLVALLALMLLGALAMGLTALVGRLFGATI